MEEPQFVKEMADNVARAESRDAVVARLMFVFDDEGSHITKQNYKTDLLDGLEWGAYRHYWKKIAHVTKEEVLMVAFQLLSIRDGWNQADDDEDGGMRNHWAIQMVKYRGLLEHFLQTGDRPNVKKNEDGILQLGP